MNPLLLAGTGEQRRHFADVVTSGGFSALALTETDSGSDAGACCSTAKLVGDEYIILNGHKCFITNGDLANIYTVVAFSVQQTIQNEGFYICVSNVGVQTSVLHTYYGFC